MKKRLNFGPNFDPFCSNLCHQFFLSVSLILDVIYCSKLLLYAMSRKTYDPDSVKWWKTLFWTHFRSIGPKFGLLNFSFKHLAFKHQSLDIMVSYHHIQYQKKLMIQSWKNLLTERWTDDRQEWFHRLLSD